MLHLTGTLPFPPYGGGELREWQWLCRLSGEFEVHLVSLTRQLDRDVDLADEVLRHASSLLLAETLPSARAPAPASIPARLWEYRCPPLRERVARLAAPVAPHVVQAERSWMLAHLPAPSPAPLLLVCDNVEHLLERQAATLRGVEPAAVERGCRRMLAQEVRAWRRADLLGAVSRGDGELMHRLVPRLQVRWLPPAGDHLRDAAVRPAGGRGDGPPTLGYVASYDWHPSGDAAAYLLSDVWPRVKTAVPAARLLLAGRGAGPDLEAAVAAADSVTLTGPVPSLAEFMRVTDVVICPLRIGGGVKMKMLEALSAGCAIVTTPVGLQGMPGEASAAVAVAEGAERLAAEAAALLASPERRDELSARARAVGRLLPSWEESSRRLRDAWLELAEPAPAGD